MLIIVPKKRKILSRKFETHKMIYSLLMKFKSETSFSSLELLSAFSLFAYDWLGERFSFLFDSFFEIHQHEAA
jgi:hypothetical protein